MRLSRRISKYLETRREANVSQMMKEHAELVLASVQELAAAMNAAISNRRPDAIKAHERVQVAEREADTMKRRIAEEIVRGEMEPQLRADMMRLDRHLDDIGDWALESSRVLEILATHGNMLPLLNEKLKAKCTEMTTRSTECAELTKAALESALKHDAQGALDYSERAERVEESVDGLYEEVRAAFVEAKELKLTPAEAILFMQLVDAVENTTDRCESTCDQIRVVAVYSL